MSKNIHCIESVPIRSLKSFCRLIGLSRETNVSMDAFIKMPLNIIYVGPDCSISNLLKLPRFHIFQLFTVCNLSFHKFNFCIYTIEKELATKCMQGQFLNPLSFEAIMKVFWACGTSADMMIKV